MNAAQAERQRVLAMAASAKSNADRIAAAQALVVADARVAAAQQAVTQTARAMTAAQVQAATAARALAGMQGILAAVKGGLAGLVSMLGGPVTIAFTAAAVAAYALWTHEDTATKYAREHADAMKLVSSNADVAGEALKRYKDSLAQMNEEALKFEKVNIERKLKEIVAGGSAYRSVMSMAPWAISDDRHEEIRERLSSAAQVLLPDNFKTATLVQLEEAKKKVQDIATEFGFTKEAAKSLETFDALLTLAKQGMSLSEALEKVRSNAMTAGAAIKDMMSQALDRSTASLESKLALTKALPAALRKNLDSTLRDLGDGKSAADPKTVLEKYNTDAEFRKSLTNRAALQAELDRLMNKNQGGANSMDNAKRALEGINAEIEKLNRTGDSFEASLKKKLLEVAKTARESGLSIADAWAKAEEYEEAARGDNTRKYNEAIRDLDISIANLNGDMETLRTLEREKAIEQYTQKFAELGPVTEEARRKIEALATAQETQTKIKDASAAAQFYKDLYVMSSRFGEALAANNELLDIQADNFVKNAGVSKELADQWKQLKQLESSREGIDGARRAFRNYFMEATNAAKNIETAINSSFSSMEDTLVDFVRTGKLEFTSLANSIIADLARIAIRQSITGPLMSGLSSALSGLFSAGSSMAAGSSVSTNAGWGGAGYDPALGQNVSYVPIHHTGGVAGVDVSATRVVSIDSAEGLPRYHGGGVTGVKNNERLAVLEYGEPVFTRAQAASLAPVSALKEAFQEGQVPQVSIQIVDQRGKNAPEVEVQQTPTSNGGLNIQAVIKAEVQRTLASGGADNALRGRYGLKPQVVGR